MTGTTNIDFPFAFDATGRTQAPASYDKHVQDMLELILFTAPGERVNRPDFGTGLLQLVFAPNSVELAATVQYTAHAAVQRWLADVVELVDLKVEADDAALRVSVVYIVKRTGQQSAATFTRPAA
jgi:phage baseplate assembly protein W